MTTDPWSDEDRPPPRSNWGCAIAAIIGSVATVIAIIIVFRLANAMLS